MFRVAEFAHLAGVSPRMLRKWDGIGLFRPAWVDPSTGYRAYSPAQLPELRRILALRDVGMPLAEIAALRGGTGDLREALARRRRELERARRDAERRLQALEIGIAMADDPSAPDVVVRPIEPERVAVLRLRDGEDDASAFYELEAHVRDLGRRRSAPPGETRLDAQRAVFVPVTRPVPAVDRIDSIQLPGIQAATVVHRGDYDGLGPARDALERWVAAAGLRPDGPLRVLYLQFGAEAELRVPRRYLVDRDADLVTELQLPVA
jgi:DNA-binding transcriptional MerR regulator/effector-binding domain-containing protein